MTGRQSFAVIPPIERFLKLTRINSGRCWDWLGATSSDGYGQFVLSARRGVRIAPYRFIWEWISGSMGELEPDHTCNNRNCVNPQHIEPVTHAENQRRSYQRGRKRGAYIPKPKPTHCPHGHEYTANNTITTSQNTIQCRECNRIRCAAYQARKHANSLTG